MKNPHWFKGAFRRFPATVLAVFVLYSPMAFGQWEKVTAPSQTSVKKVFHSGDTYYAVADYAAYKSQNYGQTWKEIFNFESGSPFRNIRFQQDTFYFLAGNEVILKGYENPFGQVGFHGGFPGIQITDFVLAGAETLVTNGQVVQRLVARTNSWETIGNLPYFPSYLNYLYEPVLDYSNGMVWLYGDQGLMRSEDGGVSWEILSDTLNVLSMFFHGDTILCETKQQGTLRSLDNGHNWTMLGNFYHFEGFYQSGDVLFGNLKLNNGASKIYASADFGETWAEIPSQPPGVFARDFLANGNLFFAATEKGVIRSEDAGQRWSYVNTGLIGRLFNNEFHLSSLGEYVVYMENATSHFSANGGQTWEGALLDNYFGFAELNGNFFTGPPTVYQSTGDITTWTPVSTNFFQDYYVFSSGSDLGAFNSLGWIVRSQDKGLTWDIAGYMPTPGEELVPHQGFLFTWNNAAIVKSQDFGSTWEPVGTAGIPGNFSLKTLRSYENKLLATDASLGMFLSQDGGGTWTEISQGLQALQHVPGFDFQVILIGGAGIVVVNAENEVFFTPDFGQNWVFFQTGIETSHMLKTGAVTQDAFYLGAGEDEIWRRDFSTAKLFSASGLIFNDENDNGIRETTESGMPGLVIELTPSGLFTASGLDGQYAIAMDVPGDTIRPVLPTIYAETTPPFYALDNSASGLDFGVHLLPGKKDLSVTLTPNAVFRPGFSTLLTLTYTNEGTTIASGKVDLSIDDQLLIENALPPAFVSGNVLSWDFADLQLFEKRNILLEIKTPADALVGAPLAFFSQIDTLADLDTGNNFFVLNTIVTGAFDPNDKQVQPESYTLAQAGDGEPLVYTVRFQNTGNFPASFVSIADTLSPYLDPASFRLLAASHPLTWTMEGAGIVKFNFDSISLPDSSANEPASHGFIKYSIQPGKDVLPGDVMENTAHIYFDFNEAVTTNTVVTTIENPLAVYEPSTKAQFTIAPNPATGTVVIAWPGRNTGAGKLDIYSADGKFVKKMETSAATEQIDVSGLHIGAYFLRWTINGEVRAGKLVVF